MLLLPREELPFPCWLPTSCRRRDTQKSLSYPEAPGLSIPGFHPRDTLMAALGISSQCVATEGQAVTSWASQRLSIRLLLFVRPPLQLD